MRKKQYVFRDFDTNNKNPRSRFVKIKANFFIEVFDRHRGWLIFRKLQNVFSNIFTGPIYTIGERLVKLDTVVRA